MLQEMDWLVGDEVSESDGEGSVGGCLEPEIGLRAVPPPPAQALAPGRPRLTDASDDLQDNYLPPTLNRLGPAKREVRCLSTNYAALQRSLHSKDAILASEHRRCLAAHEALERTLMAMEDKLCWDGCMGGGLDEVVMLAEVDVMGLEREVRELEQAEEAALGTREGALDGEAWFTGGEEDGLGLGVDGEGSRDGSGSGDEAAKCDAVAAAYAALASRTDELERLVTQKYTPTVLAPLTAAITSTSKECHSLRSRLATASRKRLAVPLMGQPAPSTVAL